jgi:hypothetical protein
MISIQNINNIEYLNDDIYEYIKIYNCKNYKLCTNTCNDWLVDIEINPHNIDTSYYFIIDTEDEALAHWVFECLIHINLFHILKKKYKNIKLFLKKYKNYKKIFLELFNINSDDIIYNIDNFNNVVFIPKPTALNYKGNNDLHYKLIDNLFSYFSNININNDSYFNYTIMPRQKIENSRANDVYISYENLKTIFNKYYKYKYTILNTDMINNLIDQINIVSNSDNIIITDGSPFLVNGLFCKNKNIHLCGRLCTEKDALFYPGIKKIIDNIKYKNNNNVISYINEMDFISKNMLLFK